MTEEKNLMTDEMFQCVGIDEQSSETLVRPSISYWQDAVRRLKKNKVAMISLFFLIFMIFMCILHRIFIRTHIMSRILSW
ncbi:MAG: hypothetical protein ACLUUO_19975 [Sellimonas intestinalis]